MHVSRSLVDLLEVSGNDLFNRLAIFEDFRVLSFHFPFDSGDHRKVSLDSEDLVRHLVELLHLAFSQQLAEVLDIFRLLKGTGNR
jgi:hypothetical protein